MGLFISYFGMKELLDKTAKLSLAKSGLWTNRLGFVDWNDLTKAQVVEGKSGRAPQTILEIYLRGTVFAEENQPDERLAITEIDGKDYVEILMESLRSKRNDQA